MKPVVWILAGLLGAAVGWRVMVGVIRAAQEKPTMQLTCSAFKNGEPIPVIYTGEGKDVSPPLTWGNLPEGTKTLALIVDDPDAPGAEPWVHWVAYNMDASIKGLPEGLPKKLLVDQPKVTQGRNSWPSENIGYRGPMPPPGHGVHHYHFHLYALDAVLDLRPGADKSAALHQMRGHVLGECERIGTYERKN